MALTNKYDYQKNNYQKIIEELIKKIIHGTKELIDEINQNDLTYYFKFNTSRKTFDFFNNGIELFKKIKSGEIKLEQAKKMQTMFKSNINKKSIGRYKSKEQKSALENFKLL